eukprot:TRINITY_DN6702_c0_g1_i1.p1 TRINITY_DN6702_c0_g1~~TRINITY_DN6702_c0_g1_i1.p1  ORF type:complete len:2466 (+),score=839.99 TRINITY_DN6702_c0_g1_i1:133-7530(+)
MERRSKRRKDKGNDSDDEPDVVVDRDGRSSHSGSRKSGAWSHVKKSLGGGSFAGRSLAGLSSCQSGDVSDSDDEWDATDTLAGRYTAVVERHAAAQQASGGKVGTAADVVPNAALLQALKSIDAQLEARKVAPRDAKKVITLDLSQMHVGHNHVLHLCRTLHQGCPLHALSLRNCHLHSTVIPCLMPGLLRGRLERLDLSNNPSLCYMAGREVLTLLKRKPRLTEVDVANTGMQPTTVERIQTQAAKNRAFMAGGGVGLPAIDPFAGFHMPRSFLSVHYPPVLLSFALKDAAYVRRLCSVLSDVDPRLAGAFACFYQRKTSPDYQAFIKTCFVEADYVLIVVSKHWAEDVQCKAEVTWFKGRTDLVVMPEVMAAAAAPSPKTPAGSPQVRAHPSPGAEDDDEGYDAIAATAERLATFQTASSAYLPPPETKVLEELKCTQDHAAATRRAGPLPVPPNLKYIPASHRFYLPPQALEVKPRPEGAAADGDVSDDDAAPLLQHITAFIDALCQELRSSQSFQLPTKGGIKALSKWRKTFVFIVQSLTPDNPTHVSLYPRLVKRMQLHRKENSGEPYLPHLRQLTRFEQVIHTVLASSKNEGKAKTPMKGGKKRKGNQALLVANDASPKKPPAAGLQQSGDAAPAKKRVNIFFDVDPENRFFYARQWRASQQEGRIPPPPPPLLHREKLYVPNPHRLRLRQVLGDEERRVAKERAALTRECRALRISQRSLASNVRLINKLETTADADKAKAGKPLTLLLPHVTPSVIREVRALKEPRLTDNVRLCAKAVLMITDDQYLDAEGRSLTWWWEEVQSVFAVENQLLYRISNLPRVRKRQWGRIKDFLMNTSFSQDHASVEHDVWAEEALHGARPRGAIALLARWVHCVYNQYVVNVRLENDVYRYVDDLHDEYKKLSDKVTSQELKVNLLQIGVGYLQQKVGDIIKEYTRTDAERRGEDDGDAPDPAAAPHYRLLRRCPLLQALPDRVVKQFALEGSLVKVDKKGVVASTGDLYVVVAGRLMLQIVTNDVGGNPEDLEHPTPSDAPRPDPKAQAGLGSPPLMGYPSGRRKSSRHASSRRGSVVPGARLSATPAPPQEQPQPTSSTVRFAAFDDTGPPQGSSSLAGGLGGLVVSPPAEPAAPALTSPVDSLRPTPPSASTVRFAAFDTPDTDTTLDAGADPPPRPGGPRERRVTGPKAAASAPADAVVARPPSPTDAKKTGAALRFAGVEAADGFPADQDHAVLERTDSVSTATQSVIAPGPGVYNSRRSVQSSRSFGTGTETSLEMGSGMVCTLHSGQWVFEDAFLQALNPQHVLDKVGDDAVKVVSLGESRGRPAVLFRIPRDLVLATDCEAVYDAVRTTRAELAGKARKVLFLQQLPLLKGVGAEVLLSVAPSVEEVSYLPEQPIVAAGDALTSLTIITTGGVVMPGAAEATTGLCFFPSPEQVVSGVAARHDVRAGEYGCRAYVLSGAALLTLASTSSSLRDKLTVGAQVNPAERIQRIAHDAASYPYQDLNAAFQATLASAPTTRAEAAVRQATLLQLRGEFLKLAVPLAEMLISEVYLGETPELRQLPPVHGATNHRGSGGQRYVANGIFFEVASNKGNLYGDLAGASKALKHEFRAWEAVLATDTKGLCVPLAALITFKGFRVKALPLLPLDGRETVVYGGYDGTQALADALPDSPELAATLKSICTRLNLKGHRVNGGRRLFYGPADLEVRRGVDGRFYLLRPGRLFPCSNVKPGLHDQGQWLVQLMRPELVAGCKKALSSDAFTRWGAADRLSDDPQVAAECRRLHADVLPAFATHLATAFEGRELPEFAVSGELHSKAMVAPFEELCKEAHQWGINIRHFAALVALLPLDAATPCTVLHIELVARTFKSTLAKALRAIPKPTTENCDHQATHLLSQLFGRGTSNTAFWRDVLYPACKDKFGFASLATFFESLPTMYITTKGVGRVEYIGFTESLATIKAHPQLHMLMLARVCDICGLRLSLSDAKAHAQRVAERADAETKGRRNDAHKKMSGHRSSSMHSGGSSSGRGRKRAAAGQQTDDTESAPFHFLDGTVPIVHSIVIPQDDDVNVARMKGRLDVAETKLLARMDGIKAVADEESGSLVRPLIHLAEVYRAWGRYDREGEAREKALDLCVMDLPFDEASKAKQHSLDEAVIMVDLAWYHLHHGTLGKACHLVMRAEDILKELGFDAANPTMQRCLFVVGDVQEAMLNHGIALDAYQRVRDAAVAAKEEETSRTRVLASLGVAKALIGSFELADGAAELDRLVEVLLAEPGQDACGGRSHELRPASPSCGERRGDEGAERAYLLARTYETQYGLYDLKAEYDNAFGVLLKHHEAWWRWVDGCKGRDLVEAVQVLVKNLALMQQLLASEQAKKVGTAKFDDLVAAAFCRLPEAARLVAAHPQLAAHAGVPAVAACTPLDDVIRLGCVATARWHLAAALTVREHCAENTFEELEVLTDTLLA